MIVVVVAFLASSAPTTMTNGPCFNNLRALPCAMLPIQPSFSSAPGTGLPTGNPEFPPVIPPYCCHRLGPLPRHWVLRCGKQLPAAAA